MSVMVKRRIRREAKGNNERNGHLIVFSSSILTIVVAVGGEETINCSLDEFRWRYYTTRLSLLR
jgi:hypothetical protein